MSADTKQSGPRLSDADIAAFAPDAKIALLATADADGAPHLTLITTLEAKDATHLMFGQFTDGLSKVHVRAEPRVGFLVMNADKMVWRGRARWTHAVTEGAEYEHYNRKPIYRYNAYFGIHTVHYLDLVGLEPTRKIAVGGVVAGTLMTAAARLVAGGRTRPDALIPWAASHIAKAGTLKFLSWIGPDGYPVIVPVVPAHPAGRGRVVVAPTVFRSELDALPPGTNVALYALNLQMESVLIRGAFSGWRGIGPARVGAIDIDWVYNSMPPVHGQVYPRPPLEPVREF